MLAGLIRKRSRPSLDQIADIDLVMEQLLDGSVGPEMIDTPGIATALLLIVVGPWRLDAFLIQGPSNRTVGHAGDPHGENPPDHRGGILVNNQMVLVCWVSLVTAGRVRPHKLTVFRTGPPYCTDLFACVSAVELVEQIQKAHDIRAAVLFLRVNAVVERDKPASDGREKIIGILAELYVIPAEPREVLYQNDIDPTRLGIRDQPLNARTLEICSRIAVINIGINLSPAPFPDIPLEQKSLILNADGFLVTLVI